ncbi:MAG: hypothetical protein A2V83_05405 [Nitrospirae bacterium RBG_16_64_22]|nr:MAG: hypothetical protein A2V83_05405 [Nitrospirae bacterium RBG_16_64_22]
MTHINPNEIDLLYSDKKDADFWKRNAREHGRLYWVRAMTTCAFEEGPATPASLAPGSPSPAVRAGLYKALARAFRYADEALARDVSSGAFRRDAASAVSVLGKAPVVDEGLSLLAVFEGLNPEDVLDHLQTKHTRLFYDSYMPFVPPYESIYSHEQQMNGARAERAREIYRQGGFPIPAEEMVDHISVELDCLAHLLGQQGSAEGAEGLASSLLFDHLVRWAGKFCADVENLSGSEFYRGAAMILRGALSLEEKGREGGA